MQFSFPRESARMLSLVELRQVEPAKALRGGQVSISMILPPATVTQQTED
jgi:hypothetical protein